MGNRCGQEVEKYSWKEGEEDLTRHRGCPGMFAGPEVGELHRLWNHGKVFPLCPQEVTRSLKHRLELRCLMTVM